MDQKKILLLLFCVPKVIPLIILKNSEIKNLSNVLTDENNQIFHAGTYEKK